METEKIEEIFSEAVDMSQELIKCKDEIGDLKRVIADKDAISRAQDNHISKLLRDIAGLTKGLNGAIDENIELFKEAQDLRWK
ncbi:MAG: hypothetical protein V3R67_08785 [Thermodesulfobacteriota bacterium]